MEHGGDGGVLVAAIHGAVVSWGGMSPRENFDPAAHLNPETIYSPRKFGKYLSASAGLRKDKFGNLTPEEAAKRIRELQSDG
jgi:hypothetical protein